MPTSVKIKRADKSSNTPLSLTLRKGLSILNLFDSDHPEWTFTEIWNHAGLSRPTAFRLVRTLEEARYLFYDSEKGTYHLGANILKATYLMLSASEVARIARPYMNELAAATTETVHLAVEADGEPLIIARVLTSRPFKPDNPVGMSMPGLANVHSRILLAHRSEREQREALAARLEKSTEYTVTDPELLFAELAKIHREGVACSLQEWYLGMCAVGAPVFDAGGAVRASLAVVAPSERFDPKGQAEYAAAVKMAAGKMSRALGYRRS